MFPPASSEVVLIHQDDLYFLCCVFGDSSEGRHKSIRCSATTTILQGYSQTISYMVMPFTTLNQQLVRGPASSPFHLELLRVKIPANWQYVDSHSYHLLSCLFSMDFGNSESLEFSMSQDSSLPWRYKERTF